MTARAARDDASPAVAGQPRDFVIGRRMLMLSLAATLLVALFGLQTRLQIMVSGLARPTSGNIYFRMFAMHEAPFMLLMVLAVLAAAVLLARRPSPAGEPEPPLPRLPRPDARAVTLVAAAVFAVALAAWYAVHHALLFSMDEFAVDFQARIFAAGDWRAALRPEWRPYAPAVTPIFIAYMGHAGSWLSMYLPGYALLKTPFVALGAGMLLNPLAAGASIAALGGVARRLWPDEGLRPWVAIAFLATSSQFLITSGSGYTMPGHLCLNLIWLWLYSRDSSRAWAGAMGVGVLAFALHQPFPHVLFVAPFMLRLLLRRQWRRVAVAAAVYGAAAVVLLAWLWASNPFSQAQGGPGLLSVFGLPDRTAVWLHMTHAAVLLSWQAPLFGVLLIWTMLRIGRLGRLQPMLVDLAIGVVLTVGFYLLFPGSQGHGWGYRYVYSVLGSMALLAAAGVPGLLQALGARRGMQLVAASFAVALLVQVPLRLWQTERFVRPFAAGHRYVLSRPAKVVLVYGDSIWYGRDLVRNDPYLRAPVVVNARAVSPFGRAELERVYPGQVVEVRDGELLRLGMTRWTGPR